MLHISGKHQHLTALLLVNVCITRASGGVIIQTTLSAPKALHTWSHPLLVGHWSDYRRLLGHDAWLDTQQYTFWMNVHSSRFVMCLMCMPDFSTWWHCYTGYKNLTVCGCAASLWLCDHWLCFSFCLWWKQVDGFLWTVSDVKFSLWHNEMFFRGYKPIYIVYIYIHAPVYIHFRACSLKQCLGHVHQWYPNKKKKWTNYIKTKRSVSKRNVSKFKSLG